MTLLRPHLKCNWFPLHSNEPIYLKSWCFPKQTSFVQVEISKSTAMATSPIFVLRLQRMNIPFLGGGLHPQHPAYATATAASVTYTTSHSNARCLTHWARLGIEPTSSWILVRFRFITIEPLHELQRVNILFHVIKDPFKDTHTPFSSVFLKGLLKKIFSVFSRNHS